MDINLIKQQQEFKKRAISQPVVEKRRLNESSSTPKFKKPNKESKSDLTRPTGIHPSASFPTRSFASLGGSNKFSSLAQIVNFMKSRHQLSDFYPLTIDEILEECKLDEVLPNKQKEWLENEALPNNHKITVSEEPGQRKKFVYKPKYNIRDRKALLKLLDRHDQRGLGGLLMSDIEESLPQAKKCVKQLANKNSIIIISRPDKKMVVFYNDKSCEYQVEEEFQKLWRSIPVDSIDESKIEDYLKQNGISNIQDSSTVQKKVVHRRKPAQRKRKFKMHNDHLGNVLKDYSEAAKNKKNN